MEKLKKRAYILVSVLSLVCLFLVTALYLCLQQESNIPTEIKVQESQTLMQEKTNEEVEQEKKEKTDSQPEPSKSIETNPATVTANKEPVKPQTSTQKSAEPAETAKTEDKKEPAKVDKDSATTSATSELSNFEWTKLKETYPGIQGWIYFPAVNVSRPIMQASDNEKYLSHSESGNQSIYGSIFMDYRNKPLFTDDNTILYGHSSTDGKMFSFLSRFLDQKYFSGTKNFWILTPERNYICQICAVILDKEDNSLAYEIDMPDNQEKYNRILKEDALFCHDDWGSGNEKYVTLSTCNLDSRTQDPDERIIIRALVKPCDERLEISLTLLP